MSERPAILSGRPAVPAGMLKKWPPIDDADHDSALASLHQDNPPPGRTPGHFRPT